MLDYTQWHDFDFLWTPSQIAFSIDGIQRNMNTTRVQTSHPMRLTAQNDYLVPLDATVKECIWRIDNVRCLAPAA